MAALFSQSQVEQILGLQPGQATGGYAQNLINTNPQAAAAYNAAVAQATSANNAARTDPTGIVPATVEPLHQYEREALTALGSNNIGALRAAGIDPRATQFLDRFGQYSDEAAGMVRAGTKGFDQEEFDQYFNPYQEEVTERSIDRLSLQAQEMRANLLRQTASNRGNATFGDLYGAQRMGDIDRELIQTSGDVRARSNESGFNTALESLFRQRANQIQGGNALGGMGGQFVNAAGQSQNVSNNGYQQALLGLTGQLGAGTTIRDYNQDLANLAFSNMTEPTRFNNELSTSAVQKTPGIQGGGISYTTEPYNRFSNIASGAGGAITELSKIRF